MGDTGSHYQVVFPGVPPGTNDREIGTLIVKLIDAFQFTPDQAMRFLQLRNFIIRSALPQEDAVALAARLQAIGLHVEVVPMPDVFPSRGTAPLVRPRGTGELEDEFPILVDCPWCSTRNRLRSAEAIRASRCASCRMPLIKPEASVPAVMVAPSAAAVPGESRPQEEAVLAAAAARNGSPEPAAVPSGPSTVPDSGIVICPECQTKNRVKDPANVRCVMCGTRIQVSILS